MKFRLIIGLLFLINMLSGQALLSGNLFIDKFNHLPVSDAVKNGEYEGSPFLIDSFVEGILRIKNEATYKMPMRYNLYGDVLDVKYKGRDLVLTPNDIIEVIEIKNHKLVTTLYEFNGTRNKGFLFLLDTGKVNLLMKKNISFEDWRPARAQEAGPKLARFKESLDAFFLQSGTKVTQIKNIKDLPGLFSSNRSKVTDFIKKNKTKLKQEKLIELVKYYNSLQVESKS
jgi:hypothetical protein